MGWPVGGWLAVVGVHVGELVDGASSQGTRIQLGDSDGSSSSVPGLCCGMKRNGGAYGISSSKNFHLIWSDSIYAWFLGLVLAGKNISSQSLPARFKSGSCGRSVLANSRGKPGLSSRSFCSSTPKPKPPTEARHTYDDGTPTPGGASDAIYWREQPFDLAAPVTMIAEEFKGILPLVSCVYSHRKDREEFQGHSQS